MDICDVISILFDISSNTKAMRREQVCSVHCGNRVSGKIYDETSRQEVNDVQSDARLHSDDNLRERKKKKEKKEKKREREKERKII